MNPVPVGTVDPVVIESSKFFYKTNGSEFQIRGIGYQNGTSDADVDMLADWRQCGYDIPYLKALDTNVVRVDFIDPDAEHSECMSQFADDGIYVLVSLLPLKASGTKLQAAYDTTDYNRSRAVIDNMGKYTNTLGFYAPVFRGDDNNIQLFSLAKATIRDAKDYIASKQLDVPVGTIVSYLNRDQNHIFPNQAVDYFSCDNVQSDFLGVRWDNRVCPQKDWIENLAGNMSDASMPVFIASTGCNNKFESDSPLNYPQDIIYDRKVADVLSGAVLYEYFGVDISDGLISKDTTNVSNRITGPVYGNLSSTLASFTISTINKADHTPPPTRTTACPSKGAEFLMAVPTLPPTPNDRVCKCMMSSLSCVAQEEVFGRLGEYAESERIFDLMQHVCGPKMDKCNGTAARAEEGLYGAFNSCEYMERWSWDMSYWSRTNSSSDGTCAARVADNPRLFAGAFSRKDPSVSDECKFILDQAGPDGTSSITDLGFARVTDPSSPTNSPPAGSGKEGGLSVGAKAGIGLGAAAGVIAALLLALFILHRKKKAKKRDSIILKAELDGTGVDRVEKHRIGELDHGQENAIVEAPGVIAEVPAMNDTPYELHGDAITGELPAQERHAQRRGVGDERAVSTERDGGR